MDTEARSTRACDGSPAVKELLRHTLAALRYSTVPLTSGALGAAPALRRRERHSPPQAAITPTEASEGEGREIRRGRAGKRRTGSHRAAENQEPMFASKEHYEFFKQTCERLNADCYLKALIYTVGISEDTRSRWSSFYDEKERTIKPEVINSGWQTSGSVRITRLAFQLFTDSTPTAIEYDKDDNPQYSFKECQLYSVSDTFCCSYAPFFVEAVKLRYPDYFSPRKVYRQ